MSSSDSRFSQDQPEKASFWGNDMVPVVGIALAGFALHMIFNEERNRRGRLVVRAPGRPQCFS